MTSIAPKKNEQEATQDQAAPAAALQVQNAPSRTKRMIKQHGKLSIACAISLVVGAALSTLFSGPAKVEETAVVAEKPEAPKYVAAISRRNEPIAPLVPFEGLDLDVAEIGKRLFHDPALSGNGRVSCSTCHNVNEGGDDGLSRPLGITEKPGTRNTPTVLNSALNFVQFWDGRAKTLEEQVDHPLQSAEEMGSDWDRIIKYLNADHAYARAFKKSLGGEPTADRVREAIATYERTLITVDSRFDQWLEGEEHAISTEELSGYYSFLKLNCISCHQGPSVGGSMFQPLGPLRDYFQSKRELTDSDLGRFNVTGLPPDRYVFRVPSLRNVELTAPYLHDGSAETLEEVIEAMIKYQVGQEPNSEEVRRIGLFLRSLTGDLP